MTRACPAPPAPRVARAAGFTMLELLIAMAIFAVLGTMVVYFMRNSLDIFYSGTRESAQLDRFDTVIPQVVEDLRAVYVGDDWRRPYRPPPDLAEELRGTPQPKPPPVAVRFRAGTIFLPGARRVAPDGSSHLEEVACPFLAFVVADAAEWSHKLKRRAGETPAEGAKPLTPAAEAPDARYLATGGLMEVVWIAVPREDQPALLDLYRGWRAPVGDPAHTLLDPRNLDTREKIAAACRVREKGLLHFGITLRRVFARTWDPGATLGDGSETLPYVGPAWDSTRAFNLTKEDPNWRPPLTVGPDSLVDPSDDIFPAFVRLEVVLARRGRFSDARGDLAVLEPVSESDLKLRVTDTDLLLGTGLGARRHLKVGTEWMEYDTAGVDPLTGAVSVRRGVRGTRAQVHPAGARAYVGDAARTELRLPVFRDRYASGGVR